MSNLQTYYYFKLDFQNMIDIELLQLSNSLCYVGCLNNLNTVNISL